ncbi:hypothetical protein GF361_00980 [Candidatus Woesearchaeota archaeon]|nr:hypothetical protein [Candidatus Woesearchaeota archaeon]
MKFTKLIFIIISFSMFVLSGFLLFEPGTLSSPTGHFVYTPSLAVINSQNNIPLDQDLEIEFITKGTNNLTIMPSGKMKLIELRCKNITMGKKMEYEDYSCSGNNVLKVKILSENLKINIRFGDMTQPVLNTVP